MTHSHHIQRYLGLASLVKQQTAPDLTIRPYAKIIGLLLLGILLPFTSAADPLNGGMDGAFGTIIVILLAVLAVTLVGLILSIQSYRSPQKPPVATAWVFVILTKAISIGLQLTLSSLIGYFGMISLPADIGIVLLLAAAERHLTGRKFLVSFFIRAVLTISIASNSVFYFLGMERALFFYPYAALILSKLLFIGLGSWFVYKLLGLRTKKGIEIKGIGQPFLWGVFLGLLIYLAQCSYTMLVQAKVFLQNIPLLGSLLIGVFPHNVIIIASWCLPGIIAHSIYTAHSRRTTV